MKKLMLIALAAGALTALAGGVALRRALAGLDDQADPEHEDGL